MTSQTPEERPNIEEEKVAIKLWNIALDEDNKNARQEFRDVLHQQLQKARQDWLRDMREEIKRVAVTTAERNQALNELIAYLDHSELDQDTQLLDTIKKDWDTQAENLINGLDPEVSK